MQKMGRNAIDSSALIIDHLEVPIEAWFDEEGVGFLFTLHGLNPKRIQIAVEAIGLGQLAIEKACQNANERIVPHDI